MQTIQLRRAGQDELTVLTDQLQQAFQAGFEEEFGTTDSQILPAADVAESFSQPGAEAYFALLDDEIVGGAIISGLDENGGRSLDFLYVKVGTQSRGIGQQIWAALERLYLDTKVWQTHTPYFDKRNIHFYVNRLGFAIVEFFNPRHPDPRMNGEPAGGMPDEVGQHLFRFEKIMG